MSQAPAPLALELQRPSLTTDMVFEEYLDVVKRAIANHPRSLQKALGPSELGDDCQRRIGYKLLGTPERPKAPNWKATIGTAGHTWMESAFDADNLRLAPELDGQERWLIESTLTVGYVPGLGLIEGHSDLYDRLSASNWDHKFVGPTQMRKYKSAGPGTKYKAQAHLYGRGWELAGHPIRHVGIAFLPRNGELAEAFSWTEPYNAAAAQWALDRLGQINRMVDALGTGSLAVLETADDYCSYCPFMRPGANDLAVGCPGHPGSRVTQSERPTSALTFSQAKQSALV